MNKYFNFLDILWTKINFNQRKYQQYTKRCYKGDMLNTYQCKHNTALDTRKVHVTQQCKQLDIKTYTNQYLMQIAENVKHLRATTTTTRPKPRYSHR